MRWVRSPAARRIVTGLALTVFLGAAAGCGSGHDIVQPNPAPRSGTSQVWSDTDGFVTWPALPAATPNRRAWTLNGDKVFLPGSYDVPTVPYPPGIISGLVSRTQLAGYSVTTGKRLWTTTLPPLAGTETSDDKPTVQSVQIPDLHLVALDRAIDTPADPNGEDQIDLFDATTGQFLFTRAAHGLSAPILLDAGHALFDLTDGDTDHGLDEVDPRTGAIIWHNPNVAACSVLVGKILCLAGPSNDIALVDPSTGTTVWTTPFPQTASGAAFSTTAVVGNDGYFATGSSSRLLAVDLTDGHVDWNQDTGIDNIDQIAPLDDTHVAVAGLENGVNGATEQVVSMSVRTGAKTTVYAGTATDGTSTSNGGLSIIRAAGKEYLIIVDPDGSLRTLDPNGQQVASTAQACASAPSIMGDTVGCDNQNGFTLYAVPGLAQRVQLNYGNGTSMTVIGDSVVLQDNDTLSSLTS